MSRIIAYAAFLLFCFAAGFAIVICLKAWHEVRRDKRPQYG